MGWLKVHMAGGGTTRCTLYAFPLLSIITLCEE